MVVRWILASIPATIAGLILTALINNGVYGYLLGVAVWTALVMAMSR